MHRVQCLSDCRLVVDKSEPSATVPISSSSVFSPDHDSSGDDLMMTLGKSSQLVSDKMAELSLGLSLMPLPPSKNAASAKLEASLQKEKRKKQHRVVKDDADWAAGGMYPKNSSSSSSSSEGTTSKNGGVNMNGAATVALLETNYEAAMARIKILEEENAQLKEKQVEIDAAKELYLKVFEDFPALIWRSGLDKMCDYFNRTWLEWTGKTMQDEVGIGWTSGVHPDDFDECLSIYTTAFDARQAFCMEYRLMDKYGQYRWIRDHGRPFYDLDDTFLGYIGSCYDVTENKNNEHRMSTLNKTKDKLFALLTHDLRHPVETSVSLSEFLKEYHTGLDSDEDLLREIAAQIHKNARHTLERLDTLLKWSTKQQAGDSGFAITANKQQSGDTGLTMASFNPRPLMSQDLFREVLSQVDLCAKAKKITVHAAGYSLDRDNGTRGSLLDPIDEDKSLNEEEEKEQVENVMMVADKDMILTVLRSLVMNSIKFTHPGGFIDLSAQKLDQETVLLAVADTGVGMSKNSSLKLFDGSSPRPAKRGTGNELGAGMGTVLCRDFIDRHEGKIWVAETEPEHGTVIQMTLPATMAQLKMKQQKEKEDNHIYYKLGVA